MEISSLQNPLVKRIVLLQQKASERRSSGCFVVEGVREIQHCIAANYQVDTLLVCSQILNQPLEDALPTASSAKVVSVTPTVYAKIAYRSTTEGLLAIVKMRHTSLDDLTPCDNPLYIVLEGVEKPGNIGAILRSADAAKADAVIVCDQRPDLFNPNLIRSSIGARFTVPTVACSSEECISFLKKRGVQILTAQLQDSLPYYATDMCRSTALVMGTESCGLTDRWRNVADAHIRIPMQGKLDSLNVSVSTAILLFEAVRQRHLTSRKMSFEE